MARLQFSKIGITALSGAVPARCIDNRQYTEHYTPEVAAQIVEKTGIAERRFAPKGMTASDLAFAAAEKLFADNSGFKEEIDLLLFVSQTPDYRMPATAVTLQDRLGLPKTVAAFDISLGCSGFIYGLSVAYAYAQQPGIRKVLLLDGETRSRVYSAKDRTTAFLFGDAAVAAVIEKQDTVNDAWFSLHSDGSRADLIKVDAGGYRMPSSPDTLEEKVIDEHGNMRSAEHGYMNGADVFNFVLREIPKDIKETLAWAGCNKEDFDYYLFHQANAFMNNYLSKKLKLPKDRVPTSLERFGNTSSVSIPITMVDKLAQGQLAGSRKLLLCGFGVGMSWATAILETQAIKVSPLVEVE